MDDRTVDDTRRDELTRIKGEPDGAGGLKDQLAIVFHGTRELNDLARTDSRAQGVKSIELKQDLYGGGKTRNYTQTGQTKIMWDASGLDSMKITAKTNRTLTALIGALPEDARYTRNEVVRATTTITDLMNLYGQTDRKGFRRSIKEDLQSIAGIHLTANGEEDSFIGIPIAGDAYLLDKKGNVSFAFSPSFMKLISGDSAFTEYLDPAAFKVNIGRNPHAWHIYKKLASHYSANMGKKNEYTLSVKSLLEYIPRLSTYDDVAAGNRNFTDRIIEPVERDLDALVALGVLTEWDYCHANGEPLTDHEQDKRLDANGDATALPYEIAVECNLTWRFAHEYHRDELIEKKREHRDKILAGVEAKKDAARKKEERIERQKERNIAKALADEELKARRKAKKKA